LGSLTFLKDKKHIFKLTHGNGSFTAFEIRNCFLMAVLNLAHDFQSVKAKEDFAFGLLPTMEMQQLVICISQPHG
jgi:hypothetical protein